MSKQIKQLQSELENAAKNDSANEYADVELLIQHRTEPASVEPGVLAAARNRQYQRRHLRKYGIEIKNRSYPRVRLTQNLRHPGTIGPGMLVIDVHGNEVQLTGHIGSGHVAKDRKDDMWAGVIVKPASGTGLTVDSPCVLGRSQMFLRPDADAESAGESEKQKSTPSTAGPDTERMLRASVAVGAARRFLTVLDAFVSEQATEADYAQARVDLDVALREVS